MKWRTKTLKPDPFYHSGDTIVVMDYAFKPTKCSDGYTYWLTWINAKVTTRRNTYHDPSRYWDYLNDWDLVEYLPYTRKAGK